MASLSLHALPHLRQWDIYIEVGSVKHVLEAQILCFYVGGLLPLTEKGKGERDREMENGK